MWNNKRKAGFTLVELLVVIAIIGILVALLLPAVQAAREAARRMQCGNNLKQLALGLHNYHDTFKVFPTGYFHDASWADFTETWAWSALMLPYIEQNALHDQLGVTRQRLDRGIATGGAAYLALIRTTQPTFMCPSDTGFTKPGITHNNRNFNQGVGSTAAGHATPVTIGVSNYPGISGFRDVASGTANSGIFFGNSSIGMSDVLDGTSNTFCLGERETKDCRSGTWVGTRRPTASGTGAVSQVIGHNHPKLNDVSTANPWDTNRLGCGEGFSSLHPGGAQFAACDGAVRFVSETINHFWAPDPTAIINGNATDHTLPANGTYQRLTSRDDRLPVGDF